MNIRYNHTLVRSVISALFICGQVAASSLPIEISDESILETLNAHRPMMGGRIPEDIKARLGTTHVGGKYYLTGEPFLLEGGRLVHELGYGIIKLWFRKEAENSYPFNSDWNLPPGISFAGLAQHPYWKACFELPFSTIFLSVPGSGIRTNDRTAREEEEEIYELTKYLLNEYRDRDITFILQNWEGDWLLRGGTGPHAQWSLAPGKKAPGGNVGVPVPDDVARRVAAMVKWFRARQAGVNRARAEIKDSRCKVYHAIEVNKVMDCMEGIPGVVSDVLPEVEVDMVSWSSYDGLDNTGLNLFKGLTYIREQIRPTPFMEGKQIVYIGEIGIPENQSQKRFNRDYFVNRWDAYIGTCIALDIPYILQWELYCNEPKDRSLKRIIKKRSADEMRGLWLIRPDGSKGYAQEYFDELLNNAGGYIR